MYDSKDERNNRVRELSNRGISIGTIAKMEGISRQRIWQIVNYIRELNNHEYNKLRTRIFFRDNYQCQWGKTCGNKINSMTLPERKRKLIVHHIDGNHTNNDPKNMITLCTGCHSAFHRLDYWDKRKKKDYQKKCKQCGKDFISKFSKSVYCTRGCFGKSRRLYMDLEKGTKEYNQMVYLRRKEYMTKYYKEYNQKKREEKLST